MADFGQLRIKNVLMHRIPEGPRSRTTEQIEFTEAFLELDPKDQAFLQLRLRRTLSQHSRDVLADDEADSDFPKQVLQLLQGGASEAELLKTSIYLAERFFEHQAPNAPKGLVVLADCTAGSLPVVIAAKLEHEEGLRVEQTVNIAGKRTFKAEFLDDLVLGDNTQIFKVAALVLDGTVAGGIRGYLVDSQQAGQHLASYFVERVLGCRPAEQANVLTERFYKSAEKFFGKLSDPERQARYEIALLAEMQKPTSTFNPRTFARTHLDEDDRDSFLAAVGNANVPLRTIDKDVGLISTSIRRLKVKTTRGADLLIPPPMWEDGSFRISAEDGTIEIHDGVDSIKGASGPAPKAS